MPSAKSLKLITLLRGEEPLLVYLIQRQRPEGGNCASDTQAPYTMNAAVYETLVKLCADICRRNGKTELLWFADKANAHAASGATMNKSLSSLKLYKM